MKRSIITSVITFLLLFCAESMAMIGSAEYTEGYFKYDISGDIVKVYSDENNEKYVLIDLKWLEYFKNYHIWYDANRDTWTIFQNGKNKDIHQIIGGKGCDHINRNRDNCLENNLRESTHEQNCRNRGVRSDSTTRYKGVRKTGNKFQGYVCCGGKEYKTDKYDDVKDAARARDKLAIKYHGAFAYLNFHNVEKTIDE